jgi:hypothetical protein
MEVGMYLLFNVVSVFLETNQRFFPSSPLLQKCIIQIFNHLTYRQNVACLTGKRIDW